MSTKRKRILPLIMIADPDEEERGLMRAILKLVGFDVIEATNGHQALKLVRECSPDLSGNRFGAVALTGQRRSRTNQEGGGAAETADRRSFDERNQCSSSQIKILNCFPAQTCRV
jgi:hypothetical protein